MPLCLVSVRSQPDHATEACSSPLHIVLQKFCDKNLLGCKKLTPARFAFNCDHLSKINQNLPELHDSMILPWSCHDPMETRLHRTETFTKSESKKYTHFFIRNHFIRNFLLVFSSHSLSSSFPVNLLHSSNLIYHQPINLKHVLK